ncbi:MAG: cupin domain-containing protein [Pseudomonadota bacterium]
MNDKTVSETPQPVAIDQELLNGKGLTKGDPEEFETDAISQEDGPAAFSFHNFHAGKIVVSVYESEPKKVRIEGSLYDEFIQILEGRLILTPDGGGEYEFKEGDSLVVPKGYKGYWHMPEKYRELIVIDDYSGDTDESAAMRDAS